jgi:hypothetical protein
VAPIESKKAEGLLRLIMIVGFVAFLAGLIMSAATEGWFRLSMSLMAGGGALAILAFLLNLGAKKAFITINVALMILFAAFILVVVNFVNSRHYKRFDWTQGGRHKLTSRTLNIIGNLKERVIVTTLFKPMSDLQYYTFASLKDLLEEYKYNSNNTEIRHVDPFYDSTGVKRLAQELKIDEIQPNSVIVQCGAKYKQIPSDDLIQQDANPYRNPYQSPEPPKFKGEEAVTAAILNVTEPKQTTLCFTAGHGERDCDDFDESKGMSELSKALKRDNYKVEKVNLFEKKQVPDDCDLLVIAGPTKAFRPDELTAIRNYLGKNGKLLVMLEPKVAAKQSSGLEPLLAEYNVKVNTDLIVLNKLRDLFGRATITDQVLVRGDSGYPPSKITNKMKNENSILPVACMVDAAAPEGEGAPPPESAPPYRVNSLCKSGDGSWGETDITKPDESKGVKGPISLVVSVEPKAPEQPNPYGGPPIPSPNEKVEGPRMVVFGSALFACNECINSFPGNLDLVTNSVSWLAAKETQMGIAAKSFDVRPISVTPQQAKVILALSIILMPLAGAIAGVIVWFVRRK